MNTISYVLEKPYLKAMNKEWHFSNYVLLNNKRDWYTQIYKQDNAKVYTDNKHTLDIDKYNLFYGE